jgi:cobalt-zinc-cadmium efflux system outer membrane protein
LEQALGLAERSHPELAAARGRIDAARARALQAGLFPNPELVARMEVAPAHGNTLGEAEYLAGVAQGLPVGGRLSAGVRTEELEAERLQKELAVRRLEIRTRVHGAFGAALYAEAASELHAETARIAEEAVRVAKVRQAAGDAPPGDVARAELEQLQARLDRDGAATARDRALLALAAAMGDPGLGLRSVSGSLETALSLPSLETALSALGGSPVVKASEAAVAVERAREELARAQRIPDIDLEILYRRQEATRTDAFDAGLRIPLPLFDRNQGRIREAQAQTVEARARARLARNELERHLRDSHLRLERAMARARFLREEILPRTQTVLRGAEARYAGGDLSLADILPVRRERVLVRLSYLDALRELLEAWAAIRPLIEGN